MEHFILFQHTSKVVNAAPKHVKLVKRRLKTNKGRLPTMSIVATNKKYEGISNSADNALLQYALPPIPNKEYWFDL